MPGEEDAIEVIIDSDMEDSSLSPESIDVAELGEALHSLGRSFHSIAAQTNNESTRDFCVSLMAIRDNCIALDMKCHSENEFTAISNLSSVIHDSVYNSLNKICRNHLEKFRVFLARHKARAQFLSFKNGIKAELATLHYSAKIINDITYKGKTTLYGELTLSGGSHVPKIHLNIPSFHKVIICTASVEIIKELESRGSIYRRVGLSGIAEWSKADNELIDFTVTDVLPYAPVPITTAMSGLRGLIGEDFNYIDASRFVDSIRADNE